MNVALTAILGMSAPRLFETEPRFKTFLCKKPWHPYPCWHTKCLDCGQTISAFDFDEESSARIARGEPKHVCVEEEA